MIKIAVIAALIVSVIAGSFFVADSYAKKKKKDCDSSQNRLRLDLQRGDQEIEDEKTKAELEIDVLEKKYKAQQREIPKQTKKDLESKIEEASDRVNEAKKATKDVSCSDLEKAKKAFVKRADRAAKAIIALTEIDGVLNILDDSLKQNAGSQAKDKKIRQEENKKITESLQKALEQLKSKAGFTDADLVGDDNIVIASPTPVASPATTASPAPTP